MLKYDREVTIMFLYDFSKSFDFLTNGGEDIILSVIFIALARSYPFVPIHLSLISGTAIGIPSFILTLEHTEATTSGGFLRNVLRISLPSALTIVAMMLINQMVAMLFGFKPVVLSTYNLILAGFISQMVVWEVCRPMNKRRRLLCVCMAFLFIAGMIILPGFFSITRIFTWRMIFIIPLMIFAKILWEKLTRIVRVITKQH